MTVVRLGGFLGVETAGLVCYQCRASGFVCWQADGVLTKRLQPPGVSQISVVSADLLPMIGARRE